MMQSKEQELGKQEQRGKQAKCVGSAWRRVSKKSLCDLYDIKLASLELWLA